MSKKEGKRLDEDFMQRKSFVPMDLFAHTAQEGNLGQILVQYGCIIAAALISYMPYTTGPSGMGFTHQCICCAAGGTKGHN